MKRTSYFSVIIPGSQRELVKKETYFRLCSKLFTAIFPKNR